MLYDKAKLQILHVIIVPNRNQRLPKRSNSNVIIEDAGNSVPEANVNAMKMSNPMDVMLRM